MPNVGTKMVEDGKTARQIFGELMARQDRRKFGVRPEGGRGECGFPAGLYTDREVCDGL